jgi:hypothetical protein
VRSYGQGKALTAAAHKLARLIYAMLTRGQDYFEECYRRRVVASLRRRAQQLGMKLVPETQTA